MKPHRETSFKHKIVSKNLLLFINHHIEMHSLGCFGCNFKINLNNNPYQPDFSFFGKEKTKKITDEQTLFPAPDLIIEFGSSNGEKTKIRSNEHEYIQNGITEYWIVDIEDETIDQYLLQNDYYTRQIRTADEILSSSVIQGLSIPVKTVFKRNLTPSEIYHFFLERGIYKTAAYKVRSEWLKTKIESLSKVTEEIKVPQAFLITYFFLLILIRILFNADDYTNWDLIPFLNANTADTIWTLLERGEVHFRHPFSFPLYNVGAESVISAILFRISGHISLYWSNPLVLIFYDLIFIFILYKLIKLLFQNHNDQNLTWILLSMSPVILTFASVSAFNMQGYCVILLGIVGSEYFLAKRYLAGAFTISAGFILISQGYPIAFFLPYYVLIWTIWRIITFTTIDDKYHHRKKDIIIPAIFGIVYTLLMASLVHYFSNGVYFKKISPLNPHDYGNLFNSLSALLDRFLLFSAQSFWPQIEVDNIPVGFAPYFIYIFILITICFLFHIHRKEKKRSSKKRNPIKLPSLIFLFSSIALILFGYLPSFLNPIIKSQRSVFGDLFLILTIVYALKSIHMHRYINKRVLISVFVLLILSNIYYFSIVFSVNHNQNHSPVFDFDLSDGVVRHDLINAIHLMKKQVEEKDALLVINYPRGYSENTTDPGMFFAHLLRHYGRFNTDDNLLFFCRWCNKRYGCPFPDVSERDCASTCCEQSYKEVIENAAKTGRKIFVWQWKDQRINIPLQFSENDLHPIPLEQYELRKGQPMQWLCYELRLQHSNSLGLGL